MRTKEIQKKIVEKINKYEDLVWYARKSPDDRSTNKTVHDHMSRIESQYLNDVERLYTDETNWEHGFNSGCLAAFRYIMDLYRESEQHADEMFPDLDT